ncbi:MAG: hypothetical protein FWC19_04440 [Treponema sp.]|nr:hypothetical protein [Treponema sp.]MCL2272039.1 hypothetical protein [Treponema sp.]
MAYQFGRIEPYSQSGSTRNPNPKTSLNILGEAFRDEGMASHVKEPKEPEILLGSREEINNAIKNYRENFKDSRGHKLRKDGKEILAGVISSPPGTTKKQFLETFPVILFFLMKKYGKSLRCIILHEDEPFMDETGKYHGKTHFHIHFFVVPEPHENFRDYHPGIYAKWQAKKEGLNHWDADIRYKWRMGDWQEELYQAVGFPLGWEKDRPKELQEKRLSHKEYKIINAAKEKSILIQDEAKREIANLIIRAEKQANLILQNTNEEAQLIIKKANHAAENINTMQIQKLNEQKIEHNKISESLSKRESDVKRKENFLKGMEKAINNMNENLSGDERIAVSVKGILNSENVTGNERGKFYKIFFSEITNFVKGIIRRIREVPEQDNKNKNEINRKSDRKDQR